MMIKDLSVMIAGKAGDGVLFTGNVLAKLFKRQGWEVATYRDFPSNIRGENTCYTVRASWDKIYGLGDRVDILMAFDCEAILAHLPEIAENGIVFCDGEGVADLPPEKTRGKTFHRFLLRSLSREKFGQEIFKNMIALGALSHVLDLDRSSLERIISEMFLKRKGEDVVQINIRAASFGCEKAREITAETERHPLARKGDGDRILISGDEAVGLGALAAGCRFFAAYPICPASEIGQELVLHMPEFSGVVVQTEDEPAALNMAIGAAFAGARAMTATSGPGASLMMEAFSLAGMMEIPVVVAHVQRMGPATGMPTKSQQGDVLQWIFGSHGEFPRIVLTPGTVGECFELSVKAFNLAEKYQCPVIILTELDMGQNYRTTRSFDLSAVRIDRGKLLRREELLDIADFKRYELTADGISPRSLPSYKNGIHLAESLEHDERGYRDEDPANRLRMMDKRMHKFDRAAADLPTPRLWGSQKADVGFIAFGSTLGAVLEAMDQLGEKKVPSRFLQLRTLWPFPAAAVREFLAESRDVFVVEHNYEGELATLIKSQISPCGELKNIVSSSTRTFTPRDIVDPVLEAAR
ncbi:MAG: 2-oxoacid:acceptor oxidoreductase subunit alpha [Candidatus Aminicenantales bacterium]